jgi:hypothetical protein
VDDHWFREFALKFPQPGIASFQRVRQRTNIAARTISLRDAVDFENQPFTSLFAVNEPRPRWEREPPWPRDSDIIAAELY